MRFDPIRVNNIGSELPDGLSEASGIPASSGNRQSGPPEQPETPAPSPCGSELAVSEAAENRRHRDDLDFSAEVRGRREQWAVGEGQDANGRGRLGPSNAGDRGEQHPLRPANDPDRIEKKNPHESYAKTGWLRFDSGNPSRAAKSR